MCVCVCVGLLSKKNKRYFPKRVKEKHMAENNRHLRQQIDVHSHDIASEEICIFQTTAKISKKAKTKILKYFKGKNYKSYLAFTM